MVSPRGKKVKNATIGHRRARMNTDQEEQARTAENAKIAETGKATPYR
jgi:hypothetical protein